MEAFGSFLGDEWESLSKMFSSEDSEFSLHFINGEDLFPNQGEIPTNFFDDQSLSFPSDALDQTNSHCVTQESSNSSDVEGALFRNPIDENGVTFLHTNTFESMDSYTTNGGPTMLPDGGLTMLPVFRQDYVGIQTAESDDFYKEMTFKRNNGTPEIQTQDNDHSSDQSPKKKPRVSRENGPKNERKTKKNKKKAIIHNEEEENNTCSSEDDDSNGSESKNLTSNGKTKANRGFATDPQSLYARRRRERINERMRILQNLVPNGTKVDISTMLEEAVRYVKFLQLQIKLLSSDELWMYAPIAYNGMDMGLYQKIIPNLWSGKRLC